MTFIFKTISNRKEKDNFEFWKNDVLLKENSLYSLSNSLLDFAYGETNSLFFENADYANAPEIQKKVLDFISCF